MRAFLRFSKTQFPAIALALVVILFCFDSAIASGISKAGINKGNVPRRLKVKPAFVSLHRPNMPGAPTVSYATPQTYTAGTAITSLAPTSSGVAAPGYNGSVVTLGFGFNSPAAVASDAAGNLYIADAGNNAVKKIAVGGFPVTIGSTVSNPHGVAVDAAGNVYVSSSSSGNIYKIPVGGGAMIT